MTARLPRLLMFLLSIILAVCAVAQHNGTTLPYVGPYFKALDDFTVLAAAYALAFLSVILARR